MAELLRSTSTRGLLLIKAINQTEIGLLTQTRCRECPLKGNVCRGMDNGSVTVLNPAPQHLRAYTTELIVQTASCHPADKTSI